jgi:hypothetical protein
MDKPDRRQPRPQRPDASLHDGSLARQGTAVAHGLRTAQRLGRKLVFMSLSRHSRCLWVTAALALGVLMTGCADSKPALVFTAKAGDSCRICDQCNNAVHSCECDTCTSLAYDPSLLTLLDCNRGIWETRKQCPGGVSVACASVGGGYVLHCLGADGGELGPN